MCTKLYRTCASHEIFSMNNQDMQSNRLSNPRINQLSNQVLVIADLHVGLYRLQATDKSNIKTKEYELFRLSQYDKLADLICYTVQERSLREIWICGDLLLVPKSTPQVMYTLKTFLEKVSSVCPVKIILGNHDLEVKSSHTPVSEYFKASLVSLLANKQVSILSSAVIPYLLSNGSTVNVAFQSWRPNNAIPSQTTLGADYLVCHGDVDAYLSSFTDKLIPMENYRRVISGHIHIAKDTECFSSVGTPFPHSFADSPHTSLLVVDLLTNQVTRIPTDHLFLRFLKQGSTSVQQLSGAGAGININQMPVVIRAEEDMPTEFNISMDAGLMNMLNVLSPQAQAIVREIVGKDNNTLNTTVNLSFALNRIEIRNFLSIQHMDLDFSQYQGLTILKGENGSGKTTLFRAIQYAFFGKLKGYLKNSINNLTTGQPPKVTLSFVYNGNSYTIVRGRDHQFFKNGKIIDAFRKQDLQGAIEAELPFLQFFEIIMVEQSSSGIFSDLSDTARISLLSRLLGLDTIQVWTDCLNQRIAMLDSDNNFDKNQTISLSSKIEANKSFIEMNKNYTRIEIDSSALDAMLSQKAQLNTTIEELNQKRIKAASIKSRRESLLEQQQQNREKLILAQDKLNHLEDIVPVTKPTLPSDVTRELEKQCILELQNLTTLKNELKQLENHPDVCPTCKREWHIENLDAKIQDLKEKVAAQTAIYNGFKLKHDKSQQADNQAQNAYTEQMLANKQILKDKQDLEAEILSLNKSLDVPVPELDETDYTSQIQGLKATLTELEGKINELISLSSEAHVTNEIVDRRDKLSAETKLLQQNVLKLEAKTKKMDRLIEELTKFNKKVFTDKGLLVAELLNQLAVQLNSDHELKVETVQTCLNGSTRPALNIMLLNPQLNTYVDYQYLSGGQRLIADLRFLKGLLRTLKFPPHLLLLDEVFKFFDDNSILAASDILRDIRNITGAVFLILHGNLQQTVGDNVIELELTSQGTSIV